MKKSWFLIKSIPNLKFPLRWVFPVGLIWEGTSDAYFGQFPRDPLNKASFDVEYIMNLKERVMIGQSIHP